MGFLMNSVTELFSAFCMLCVGAVIYWFVLKTVLRLPNRADETHMVKTPDGWRFRLCRYTPETEGGEPVLLVHSMLTNQLNFALPPGESLVDALTAAGFDCWVMDFRGDRSCIPPEGVSRWNAMIDDYLMRDLPTALKHIRKATGFNKVHWVGHSMGGMVLYAYQKVHDHTPVASAVTLGSPPNFTGVDLKVPGVFLDVQRRMPSLFDCVLRGLAPIFGLIRPTSVYLPINWTNMHPGFTLAHLFNLTETTAPAVVSSITMAAENNRWPVCNGEVDVFADTAELMVPLLAVYGGQDPLTPLETAKAFVDALPTEDKNMLILDRAHGASADYNHADLAFSRNGMNEVYPAIVDWFRIHPIDEPYAEERTDAGDSDEVEVQLGDVLPLDD